MYRLETFFMACYIEGMENIELKEWRKRMNWTQVKASGELGLSRQQYIRFENGHYPVPRLVELACRALANDYALIALGPCKALEHD